MTRQRLLPLLVTLAGCESATEPPCFEPVAVDPSGAETTWVIDTVQMPETATSANQLGINIDCDEQDRPDNALGQFLTTVASQGYFEVAADANRMIQAGKLLHLLQVRSVSLLDADGVGMNVLHGLDTDADLTDNFDGDETFGIATARGRGIVSGNLRGGHLETLGGPLPVGFAMPMVDDVIVLPVHAARIEATVSAERIEGRIGGGVLGEDWNTILMPFLHRSFVLIIERDCAGSSTGAPPCGCIAGSSGEILLGHLDELPDRSGSEPNGDCMVTFGELMNNSLVSSLFAPDVDLFDAEGELDPRRDGRKDSLSIGIGFTAVPARIVD